MPTSRRSVRAVVLAVASSTVIAGIGLVAGPATAAAGSTIFDEPGSYTWTVPQDVTSLQVDALGGSGASGSNGAGGAPAHVVADIPVTPGETLHVHVGGNAAGVNGGSNGGGSSLAGAYTGGGGGGASDIREGGDSLADRVLVAAGSGGGSGWGFKGGDAEQPGTDGCGAAAQPGTSGAGGSGGGSGCVGYGGSAGALGMGGNGGGYPPATSYGGGGGAGYYGGGGGGPYDGGAGGSNLVPTSAANVSTALGTIGQTPYIHLSYGAAASTAHSVSVSTTDSSLPADGVSTTSVTAIVVDQLDNALAGETVGFSSTDPGISFGPVTDNGDGSYTATVTSSTTSGSPTITATDTSLTASTTLTINALPQTVTFTSAVPTTPVSGEQYAPTAGGGGSGQPVTFSVSPATSGYGTDASACSYSASTFSFNHRGTCVINADQSGNAQYSAAPTAQQVVAIGQVATATALAVGRSDVTATVTSAVPGAGTPTGTVTFSVDGQPVGTATLIGSVAHLGHEVPSGQARLVTAVYDGDGDFTGSSASTSRQDPTISARVTSRAPRTRYGWYSSPVTVRFTCTAAGAPLVGSCPGPVTVATSAAGQSVTRTIMASDGGAATATVSGINIDSAAPRVAVGGIRKGATYRGSAPAARCVGHDALSGVIRCRLTKRSFGAVTRYTSTVTDRAGNTQRSSSSYRVLRTYLARAPFRRGTFHVRGGHSYTLVTSTTGTTAPRYYSAAVKGRTPSPRGPLFHSAGTSHGLHQWTVVVRLPNSMASHPNWVLGVRAGTSMRRVHIRF